MSTEKPTSPEAGMGGVESQGEKEIGPKNLKEFFEQGFKETQERKKTFSAGKKSYQERMDTAVGETDVLNWKSIIEGIKHDILIEESKYRLLTRIKKFFPNDDELEKGANLPSIQEISYIMKNIIKEELRKNPEEDDINFSGMTIITLVNFLRLAISK